MYYISRVKFLNALKAFQLRGVNKWPNDLCILFDGKLSDWFVIEKPNQTKLREIEKALQNKEILRIEDNDKAGNATKDQYFTQVGGKTLIF